MKLWCVIGSTESYAGLSRVGGVSPSPTIAPELLFQTVIEQLLHFDVIAGDKIGVLTFRYIAAAFSAEALYFRLPSSSDDFRKISSIINDPP